MKEKLSSGSGGGKTRSVDLPLVRSSGSMLSISMTITESSERESEVATRMNVISVKSGDLRLKKRTLSAAKFYLNLFIYSILLNYLF